MNHQQNLKKRYFILAMVPIVLAIILALLPDKSHTIDNQRIKKHLKSGKYTGVTPQKLMLEAVNNNRFIQPDELAKAIVGQDPSYYLVDLRDAKQFEKFTLPNAVNIPAQKILDENNKTNFNSDAYKVVLFANGTVLPDQVWMVMRRAGVKNVKVLNGGLNRFYQLYLNPPQPDELDPAEAYDQYSFRKAVGTVLGLPNPDEFIPGYVAKNDAQENTSNVEKEKVTQ